MTKIKVKKQMNLPELLAWGMTTPNYEMEEEYSNENVSVYFNDIGEPRIECKYRFIPSHETFTVETEEEIDEDTVLPVLVMTYQNASDKIRVTSWENTSIKSVEKNHKALAYHLLNDDGTMTLIWKDGKTID